MGTVTLSSLRDQVRQRADMERSNFVTNDELDVYINNSFKEMYDIIVSRFEDYYTVKTLFTISEGNTYDLPDNFYKARGVDYDLGGSYAELSKWNFRDRNYLDRPTSLLSRTRIDYRRYRLIDQTIEIVPEAKATGNYRLWYTPSAPDMITGKLGTATIQDLTFQAVDIYSDGNLVSVEYTGGATAGSEVVTVTDNAIFIQIEDEVSTAEQVQNAVNASQDALALVSVILSGTASNAQEVVIATNLTGSIVQVDGRTYNGWEEYVVVDAAIKCLNKEESDTSILFARKQALIDRIENMAANRDSGEPEQVTDVSGGYDDSFGGEPW